MSGSIQIAWKALGQENFDRIVNALLRRRYASDPDRIAQPIDGRGGDKGKDCAVLFCGTVEIIYQYKYFPEGFSGDWKSRRTQIKRSFKSAMEHRPKRWVLIIPRNPTTFEIEFVDELAEEYEVEVSIEGEAALDCAVAENPDLADYFTRDSLLENLKVFGRDEYALDDPKQVIETLSGLHRQLNARNPYWGINYSVDDRGVTQTPYAKDPDAPSIEPIRLNVRVDSQSANYPAFQKFRDYGDIDDVLTLGDGEHEHFEIEGPNIFSLSNDDHRLEVSKPQIPPELQKPVEFRVVDEDGRTLASVVGKGVNAAKGMVGMTLEMRFPGGMHMKFTIPDDRTAPGSSVMNCHPVGQDAIAVHRERRAVETAMHRSNAVELWIDSQRGARWQIRDAIFPAFNDGDQMIAEDLAIISKLLDVTLLIPERLTVAERSEIRKLRLLLDGYCILIPEIRGTTVTMTKGTRAELETLLNHEGGLRFEVPLDFEIQSHSLAVEDVYLFHQSVHVLNKEEVLTAFDDPGTDLLTFKLESADGTPFRAFNPRLVPNPDSYMPPVPLQIDGVPEHPAIAQLTEQWQSHQDSCEQHERTEN